MNVLSELSYPTEIFPWVSVGGNLFTDNIPRWLSNNQYNYVINVSGTRNNYIFNNPNIFYYESQLYDDPSFNIEPYLEEIAREIDRIYNKYIGGERVKLLIHCQMGVSRSVSILVYWLMTRFNMSLNRALQLIKEKRSIVQPNSGFMRILSKYD